MNLNTKQIGTITEYQCATYLMNLGCIVSFPLGDFAPYDLIIDYNGILKKIQVKKSTRTNNGSISIECTTSQFKNDGVHTRMYTSDEIDYFATIYNNRCYLIECEVCNTSKQLRLEIPKNLQTKNIYWAVEYEAEYKLKQLIDPMICPRINMESILTELKYEKSLLNEVDESNSQYGSMWVTDGYQNRKINKIDKIPEGFKRGRVCNWK